MGPRGDYPYGDPPPRPAAPGWQDNVTEMEKLVAAHPTLTWHKPVRPYGFHAATWDDDDGSHREVADDLDELVKIMRARLGR